MPLLRAALLLTLWGSLAAYFCAVASPLELSAEAADVDIVSLPDQSVLPHAIEPSALAFACSQDAADLSAFFAERDLPFESRLVRPRSGHKACHIYFEPTLPGFRASRDNAKITGLYAAVHPMHFLARSDLPGYNLDIAKTVLSRLPRPTAVRLSVAGNFDKEFWAPAARDHFGGLSHRLSFVESGSLEMQPWAQDHIKAGQANGEARVLIPRRLYEGSAQDGELTQGILDRLEQDGYVRSKISWEGGGLQFVASPQDASQTIMVVGLRRYWGSDLNNDEVNYVLRTEFGADMVLDLSPVDVHSDYVVSFLPEDNVALVSKIVRESADVAREAAFSLLSSFDEEKPAGARRLASLLAEWTGPLSNRPNKFLHAIESTRQEIEQAGPETDPELDAMIARYVTENCPGNPSACFAAANDMLRKDPELVRRSSSHALGATAETLLREMLLGIVQDQLITSPFPEESLMDAAAEQLSDWGFRVVRVPHLSSNGVLRASYVNSLLFDRRLFMPSLGLGRFEERMFSRLRSDLGGRYDVIPVDARRVLMLNGGLHCVFGIYRELEAR